jgi:ribonuclease HI
MILRYDAAMAWVEARLHGQRVFARAKSDGSFLVEGNHVEVRYRRDASRAYRARVSNLERQDGAPILADDACAPAASAPAKPKRTAAAAVSGNKQPVLGPTPRSVNDAIVVYADGACSGNPGPAGLGVVIIDGQSRIEISEHLGIGTNNIAELTAIERALDSLSDSRRSTVIHTDSSYAIGVLAKGWKAKANAELVGRVRARLAERPSVRLVHVPGHAGVVLNERADELAREAVRTRQSRTERFASDSSDS